MTEKQSRGWRELVEGYPWLEGEGCYPIPAYSKSMPAPRLGSGLCLGTTRDLHRIDRKSGGARVGQLPATHGGMTKRQLACYHHQTIPFGSQGV